MQFIDLKSQYMRLKDDIDRNIHTVLDHGQYVMGPEVFELESRLAAYAGVKHCISCSSGTDALVMALMAHDIKAGDFVITTTVHVYCDSRGNKICRGDAIVCRC